MDSFGETGSAPVVDDAPLMGGRSMADDGAVTAMSVL